MSVGDITVSGLGYYSHGGDSTRLKRRKLFQVKAMRRLMLMAAGEAVVMMMAEEVQQVADIARQDRTME